jgi:hypothetical protein
MPQVLEKWKVLPHGKLTEVEDNVLTVEGKIAMPLGELPRRMTIVRLHDRRLVIFNGIALNEEEMRRIEEFGDPAFLIVPNDHHRLDANVWKQRYPRMHVIAPPGAREVVEKVVAVNATSGAFDDPNVKFVTVPGTSERESALEVTTPNGTTLVLNDIIGNIRDASGVSGWFLRMMGFAGDEAHVPLPVKLMMVKDKAALAAQLERWAALPSLKRILVSHGAPIEDDPQDVLEELATSLGSATAQTHRHDDRRVSS